MVCDCLNKAVIKIKQQEKISQQKNESEKWTGNSQKKKYEWSIYSIQKKDVQPH